MPMYSYITYKLIWRCEPIMSDEYGSPSLEKDKYAFKWTTIPACNKIIYLFEISAVAAGDGGTRPPGPKLWGTFPEITSFDDFFFEYMPIFYIFQIFRNIDAGIRGELRIWG